MTTININKLLLEQALNALLLPCDRWNKQQFLIVKGAIESLNAALAAPATAPAQPEIVDLLAEMYELILANKVVLAEKSGGVWTWPDRAIEAVRKHRSGPAWHDAPTCAGLWFCDEGDENPYRFTCHNVSIPLNPHLVGEGERWYGPIPEDKP